MSHKGSGTLVLAVIAGMAVLGPVEGASGWSGERRIPSGTSPQLVALNQLTGTLYVSNGEGVAVLGVGASAPAATIAMASGPLGVAVDQRTNTVYVVKPEDGSVAVIDGARCNARRTSGCAQAPATVNVGGVPLGIALNEATDTLYVGIVDQARVAVIDGATCNRVNRSGCSHAPARVATGSSPAFPAVDEATNTVYVPNGDDNTVSVIDGRTCSAVTTAGCGQTPAMVNVGPGPTSAIADDATHTVYVTNQTDGTLSVFDAAACSGRVHQGCARPPLVTGAGNSPAVGLALDPATRTLYVVNSVSDTVAAVDTARCSARDGSGCGRRWATLQVGEQPQGIVLDPRTRTLFIADQLDNDMSVADADACNARNGSGCRDEVPSITTGGARDLAVDPAVHTLYVTQPGSDSLALVDTLACNARLQFDCRRTPPTAPLAGGPVGIVLDRGTQTLYVSNREAGTVSVLNPRTCNTTNVAGCAPVAPPIPVGGANAELAINESTHTVYVANEADDTVSVIDARTCTASTQTGCAQTPVTVAVGHGPRRVTVDPSTNTIYVSDYTLGAGQTVSVIDGSVCDAAVTTGCRTTATITVGHGPQGMVVDPATHTLFVANQASADEPGTVSVIDTTTCDGTNSSGCGHTPPRISTALSPRALALDPVRHVVYTANLADASSSFFSAALCNARNPAGCAFPARRVATGDGPTDVAFDPSTNTVYVADSFVSPPDTSSRGLVSLYPAR